MTDFDPAILSRQEVTALVQGIVAPRPIAWVSTLSGDGVPNLAPFSFFNLFSTAPPTVGIGPGSRSGVNKDSLRNIKDTGEFVISVVTESLTHNANLSSADFDPVVDEWTVAGVTQRPSTVVAPPAVAESPASLECRVLEIVELAADTISTNALVIARVVSVHVDEGVLHPETFHVDPDRIRLVARMGGDLWCTTREYFELRRPSVEEASAESAVGAANEGEG